jgi:hypothetical protein
MVVSLGREGSETRCGPKRDEDGSYELDDLAPDDVLDVADGLAEGILDLASDKHLYRGGA